jgi:hypothetical protein
MNCSRLTTERRGPRVWLRWAFAAVVLLVAIGNSAASDGAEDGAIDWDRARALHQRARRGEQLSQEDRGYIERAREVRSRRRGGADAARADKVNATTQPTGLIPLDQMSATDRYRGEDGGLYGGGRNRPPAKHARAAEEQAAAVVPLDASGKPAPDGKVVLMSIGMSNTTQEFSRFKKIADDDPGRNPWLVIVDAAQGGRDAADWAGPPHGSGRRGNVVWDTADKRLAAAGVTPQQVQVVWIKQALKNPARLGEFPNHARALQGQLESVVTTAKQRYPNLRLAYVSSRTYGGYATTQLNPEPYAYESAFAVRWLIAAQANGDADLNFDPTAGAVRAPLVLWGPYLWADGTRGRKSDKLVWRRDDFGADGVHPSDAGRQKVADMLLSFFKTEPTTRPWFATRRPVQPPP